MNRRRFRAILAHGFRRVTRMYARVNSSRNFGQLPGWIFKILHGPREHPQFFFSTDVDDL